MRSVPPSFAYAFLAGLLSSACSGSAQVAPSSDASSGASSGARQGSSGASAGSNATVGDGGVDCSAIPVPALARLCPDGTTATGVYIAKGNACVLEFACPLTDDADASGGPTPLGTPVDGGFAGSTDGLGDVGPVAAETCPMVTVNAPATSVQPDGGGNVGVCLCTRRDMIPAGMCPRGVGQSTAATIGPAGGTVSLKAQQGTFTLDIPPTALAADIQITITETAIAPPAGFVDYSPVYRIDPIDLALAVPAKLTVPFSNGRGVGVSDQNMAIFWSSANPCTLERLPSTYINAGFAQGSTLNGGYAIVGYGSTGGVPYCN